MTLRKSRHDDLQRRLSAIFAESKNIDIIGPLRQQPTFAHHNNMFWSAKNIVQQNLGRRKVSELEHHVNQEKQDGGHSHITYCKPGKPSIESKKRVVKIALTGQFITLTWIVAIALFTHETLTVRIGNEAASRLFRCWKTRMPENHLAFPFS